MKKFITNPLTIILLVLVSGLVFSNTCCTSASSKETRTNTESIAAVTSEGSVITLTDANFDEHIKSGVVLVDFWATWCRPCRMQGPIIEEVSTAMSGKVNVCKLDIDQSKEIASKYGIESIPTMLVFKDGKIVSQFVGVTAKEDIIKTLNTFIK